MNCATEKHVRIGGLELCWDQSANEKRTLRTIATEVKGETLNSTANSPFDYISYQMQSKTWRRKWQIPTPVFLPGKFHGQRSLAGSSPWGHKESDTTEPQMRAHMRAHTHTHTHTHSKTRFFRNLYVSSGLAGELSGSSFLPEVHRRIPPSDGSLCLRSGPESIYLIKTAQAPVLSTKLSILHP